MKLSHVKIISGFISFFAVTVTLDIHWQNCLNFICTMYHKIKILDQLL